MLLYVFLIQIWFCSIFTDRSHLREAFATQFITEMQVYSLNTSSNLRNWHLSEKEISIWLNGNYNGLSKNILDNRVTLYSIISFRNQTVQNDNCK